MSAEPKSGHAQGRPQAGVWLRRLWRGGQGRAIRWRQLLYALLAIALLGPLYTAALSTLRWALPFQSVGWVLLGCTVLLAVLIVRWLAMVVVQLGLGRLLITLVIGFVVVVAVTGLLVPSGSQGFQHWLASSDTVARWIGVSLERGRDRLGTVAGDVTFAVGGERAPERLEGVEWEDGVPPTPVMANQAVGEGPAPEPTTGSPAPIALAVGGTAQVSNTASSPLRVRAEPSREADIIARLPEGTTVTIIGGPMSAEGINWWRVSSASGEGWCAADFLAPTP